MALPPRGRRGRLARGVRRRARRAPGRATARACTSSSTRAWAGSARAIPTRRRAVADAVAARRGCGSPGAMTHFATADDDPAFAREQLARFLPWARAVRARAPGRAAARRELGGRARDPRGAARHGALRDRGLRDGPVPARPGRARAGARARAALLRGRGQADARPGESAGYGRRFVAARADLARHDPDRLRRRRAARADQQLRRAGRRPPRARWSARCRWTTSPSTSARASRPPRGTEVVLIGAQRRRARARRGVGAPARRRSTTRSRAGSARACRARTHARDGA